MPLPRLRRVLALAAPVALAAGVVLAAPSAASASGGTATYYTIQPACAPATARRATCFALRRVAHTHRVADSVRAEALPNSIPVGPAGGYTPGDIAGAYNVHHSMRTGQTVAIIDAYDDPDALNDLDVFDAQYNLPAETSNSFTKINQYGSANPANLPKPNSGWAVEEALDIQAVRGLCNHCKILLVEANTPSPANLAAAVDRAVKRGVRIVSNSYGLYEGTHRPSRSILNAYHQPGRTIIASTGDDGYFDWDQINPWFYGGRYVSSEAPSFPASDNTVVAVGGTTLKLKPSGRWGSESVWNSNGRFDGTGSQTGQTLGASGGGCSRLFNARSFQHSVYHYAETACGSRRDAGDIAAVADPATGMDVYDSYGKPGIGWQTVGGTSLAAPIIAGIWGLANGGHGATYPASNLYHGFVHHRGSLHDVVTGGNGMCATPNAPACAQYWGGSTNTIALKNGTAFGTTDCAWKRDSNARSSGTRACDATSGYDGPSGVGTPNGLTAFK